MAHQRNFQIDPITRCDECDGIERLMTSFHGLYAERELVGDSNLGIAFAHSAGAGWTSRDAV